MYALWVVDTTTLSALSTDAGSSRAIRGPPDFGCDKMLVPIIYNKYNKWLYPFLNKRYEISSKKECISFKNLNAYSSKHHFPLPNSKERSSNTSVTLSAKLPVLSFQ